jgi:SAM-dependent methyltransferase
LEKKVKLSLLDVLADPCNHEPLLLSRIDLAEPDGEVIEGELRSSTGVCYPIIRGIPRFVASEQYSHSFGIQWKRFSRVQLDSFTGKEWSEERFDKEVPWGRSIGGKWVVDAGCGAGRFAEVAARRGANVVAVDLSESVDAVREVLGHMPNVHPVQADLSALPLRRDVVSGAYSLGVLQHTPDPLGSCRSLLAALPVDAPLSVTIYGRQPWTKLYAKYVLRPVTFRLRPDRLMARVEWVMPILFPLTSYLFALPVVGRVFRFVIPVANYIERDYPSAGLRYEEAVLDTFDMLSPRHDHPVTVREVLGNIRGLAGRVDVQSEVPVSLTIRRAETQKTDQSHRVATDTPAHAVTTEAGQDPLVSVIIPTFNRWPLVAEAVQSVLDQTFTDFEIIVVDDGSDDGTAYRLGDQGGRVRVVSQEHAGRSAARNRGVKESRGRYVAFLDSDDRLERWHLEDFGRAQQAYPGRRLFVADAAYWDPETDRLRPAPRLKDYGSRLGVVRGTATPLPGLVIERTAFTAAGGFPESLDTAEDFVLITRLFMLNGAVPLPRRAVRIREHPGRSMFDTASVLESASAALALLLAEGIEPGQPFRPDEQRLLTAGVHRFRAAHCYAAGDMSRARSELAVTRRAVGWRVWLPWCGRLWCQTCLGLSLSAFLRRMRLEIAWRRGIPPHRRGDEQTDPSSAADQAVDAVADHDSAHRDEDPDEQRTAMGT